MSRSSRARLLLIASAAAAAVSVLTIPILFGPLALLAAAGAVWSGARRAGAALLLTSAAAMVLGMALGCAVACR